MIGNLLFAVAKEGVAAYVAQMYACEWNIDDKLRIRKLNPSTGSGQGRPVFIVFRAPDADTVRLDCFGEWKTKPQGSFDYAEWHDDTTFDTFEEAARLAADVLKNGPGGKRD